jgi:Protein of unknown function (DUF642)
MKTLLPNLLGIAVTLACIPQSHSQNLVLNGSFESPNVATGYNFVVPSALIPWQTTDDSFEIWADPGFPCCTHSADGIQNLEILSRATNATVWQTITTVPGQDYVLKFFHSPRSGYDSALTVTIDSKVVAIFFENGLALPSQDFLWRSFTTNFTAKSSATTISFTDLASTPAGTHIDDVSVEPLPLRPTIRVSEVELCWETVPNRIYQVQYQSTVSTNSWTDLGGAIQGNGTNTCFTDPVPIGQAQRIYRIITVP